MPSPLPGPNTTARNNPALVADEGTGLGVLLNTDTILETTPKASISDTFTNLNDWVTIFGTPTIQSGNLAGEGLIRHKTQALTDSHKVAAIVGDDTNFGSTRLFCCADESLSSYYAVEIQNNLIFPDRVNFIKGVPGSSVQSAPGLLGILNSILALIFGLLSIFSRDVTPFATATSTALHNGDEIAIWYDQPNSTVRIYKNATAILNIPVPRGEIPHGEGNRWHGCAVGIEFDLLHLGALLSSYTCVDI